MPLAFCPGSWGTCLGTVTTRGTFGQVVIYSHHWLSQTGHVFAPFPVCQSMAYLTECISVTICSWEEGAGTLRVAYLLGSALRCNDSLLALLRDDCEGPAGKQAATAMPRGQDLSSRLDISSRDRYFSPGALNHLSVTKGHCAVLGSQFRRPLGAAVPTALLWHR